MPEPTRELRRDHRDEPASGKALEGRGMDENHTGSPLLTLGAATVSITLGALPVFLLGSLAIFIRSEMGFDETQLGLTASLYYASSAFASIPGGRMVEHVGPRRGIAIAATGSAIAALGIAFIAREWWQLVAFMVLAGAANGSALPATNLALARGIPRRRQGVAFGFKQSSGPLATLVAGAAVPLIGLTIGWRWAFAFAGVASIPLVAQALWWQRRTSTSPPRPATPTPTAPLVILGGAAACAVISGSALGAFYVESAVVRGLSPATAGTWLAIGSVLGIAARICWGWYGDRRETGHLLTVAALLGGGVAGFALLGFGSSSLVLAGATLLVFGSGWAWPGLFNFAVVRESRGAPAAATGITGTGQFGGGIIGPLAFGALVEHLSYKVAWATAAASMGFAALLVLVANGLLSTRPELSRKAEWR